MTSFCSLKVVAAALLLVASVGSTAVGGNRRQNELVTDKELEDLFEELILLDVDNNATALIQVALQKKSSSNSTEDVSPGNLLTVAPPALLRPTIAFLLTLRDNYHAIPNVTERFTPDQLAEMENFTNLVMSTPLMTRAQEFLASKKLPTGKESFNTLWFQLYNREGTTNSSSGFEHVFVGELYKNGGVNGFHSWVSFAVEEGAGRMDYFGYMNFADFGSAGSVIEQTFEWNSQRKPVTSMFIGTSPELELALYTVCFHARVDQLCPVSLRGHKFHVQTFVRNSTSGQQHVGTAYPDLSNYKPANNNAYILVGNSAFVGVLIGLLMGNSGWRSG